MNRIDKWGITILALLTYLGVGKYSINLAINQCLNFVSDTDRCGWYIFPIFWWFFAGLAIIPIIVIMWGE